MLNNYDREKYKRLSQKYLLENPNENVRNIATYGISHNYFIDDTPISNNDQILLELEAGRQFYDKNDGFSVLAFADCLICAGEYDEALSILTPPPLIGHQYFYNFFEEPGIRAVIACVLKNDLCNATKYANDLSTIPKLSDKETDFVNRWLFVLYLYQQQYQLAVEYFQKIENPSALLILLNSVIATGNLACDLPPINKVISEQIAMTDTHFSYLRCYHKLSAKKDIIITEEMIKLYDKLWRYRPAGTGNS